MTCKERLDACKDKLLDPLASQLANQVQWQFLEGLSENKNDLYPIATVGQGEPLLLIHGFDSCFLEFRRLAPLLSKHHQLLIPDLFGFGFCPRPRNSSYDSEALIFHLNTVLNQFTKGKVVGLIGASMGGAVAMKLARFHPTKISRLLLLSPAGLTGRPMPVPRPLDQIGVWFLKQEFVRKSLCRQAFADPGKDVGAPEEQIASLHLSNPGWGRSLAAFARSGGLANCGKPLPKQPIKALFGEQDKILDNKQKEDSINLLAPHFQILSRCGHLPHLDLPGVVASHWLGQENSDGK